MNICSIRWQNFRSFKDTEWVDIKPITIVIGPNASGKTSIHAPLLMMKQTLESPDANLPLKTRGDLFDAGSFRDLIYRHDLTKNLSFSLREEDYKGEISEKTPNELGSDPPGQIDLVFDQLDEESYPSLHRYLVRDVYGRELTDRSRLKNGNYSLRTPKLTESDKRLVNLIRKTPPEHFLFTLDPLFEYRFREAENETDEERKIVFNENEVLYLKVISFTSSWIQRLMSKISYIGPIRQRPARLYQVTGEKPVNVGVRGEHTPEIIFRDRHSELMNVVNNWVSRFEFGFELECTEFTPGAFEIHLCRSKDSPAVSLTDTGFGLSQVLPLIVQGFYSVNDAIIIAEQPEIHLNPRLQALLADLFVEITKERRSIIIETHSEHLLLRLRRLVADSSIEASKIALYYVEKKEDLSSVRKVQIEEDGHIDQAHWPIGFFEDSLSESLALAEAQSER